MGCPGQVALDFNSMSMCVRACVCVCVRFGGVMFRGEVVQIDRKYKLVLTYLVVNFHADFCSDPMMGWNLKPETFSHCVATVRQ